MWRYHFYPQTGDINLSVYLNLLAYDRSIFGCYSEVFGSLLSLEIFGKCSETFRKSPKTSLSLWLCIVVVLCNKNKTTWSGGDTKFLFSCWKIFHLFAVITRLKKNSKRILEKKFRISAPPFNLFLRNFWLRFHSFYFSFLGKTLIAFCRVS